MKFIFKNNLVFIFLIFTFFADAQDNPREVYKTAPLEERAFNEQDWKKAIEGIDYSGSANSKEKKEKDLDGERELGNEENENFRTSSPVEVSPFWGNFFQLLFILIAIIVIVIILVAILKGENPFSSKSKIIHPGTTSFKLEEVQENLHESDLDRYIREAVDAGNFQLAIRLYYLVIIKTMSLKNLIKWKKDKTNRDYLHEISGTYLVNSFKEATHIFETIWYGEGMLNEKEYNILKPKFQQWINELEQRTTV